MYLSITFVTLERLIAQWLSLSRVLIFTEKLVTCNLNFERNRRSVLLIFIRNCYNLLTYLDCYGTLIVAKGITCCYGTCEFSI